MIRAAWLALALCAAPAAADPPAPVAETVAAATDAARSAKITAMYTAFKLEFADVPEVDPAALIRDGVPDGAVLVDVREPEERAVSTLPGAISREGFEAHREQYLGKEIIVYCTIGYRSGLYAKALRAKGMDARNLPGSVLRWTHLGGTFTGPDGQPTTRVHTYNEDWNLVASGYQGVW